MSKLWQLLISICIFGLNCFAFSAPQITHSLLGYENLYTERELAIPPYSMELKPHYPQVGDTVRIGFRTVGFAEDVETKIEWHKNGSEQPPIKGQFVALHEGDCYWEVQMGPFSFDDQIDYIIYSSQGKESEKIGPFEFQIAKWVYVTDVREMHQDKNVLIFECDCEDDAIHPEIHFSFPGEDYLRMNVSLEKDRKVDLDGIVPFTMREDKDFVEIRTSKLLLKIAKSPFSWELHRLGNYVKIVKNYGFNGHGSLAFLKNGNGEILNVQENLYTKPSEAFYGFGMRYNHMDKRGDNVDIHCTNTYYEQEEKTYIPVPFYLNSGGYGFYLNSTAYSQFRLASDCADRCTILTDVRKKTGPLFEYFIFAGNCPKEIVSSFSEVIGKPQLPPVWAFGLWISANEWNRQSEIEAQLFMAEELGIPISVIVIEAWSDEETFYIFNDARYEEKPASEAYSLKDFHFTGRWPDPIGLVQNIHERNMKILLWNIPVLKSSQMESRQRDRDEAYAIQQGYVVKREDGEPYRMPPAWFGNSLLFDFTNPEACEWWFSKRNYLITELGIDGIKTDGGEFAYGSGLRFYDGRRGTEMHNAYPDVYNQAYYDYIRTLKHDGIVFGRAGGARAAQHPLTWNGDQRSTFGEFRAAIRSALSAGISGIPFVAWDMAGFGSDQMPSAELYKRSVAATAFSSIMQLHSENCGDPVPSRSRTPWNMAEITGDSSCIDVFRKFANIRMNILPYLYSEANNSAKTGLPLMRPLALEFPNDERACAESFEYMLGSRMLVAPVVEERQRIRKVYLPEGEWIDFWDHTVVNGPTTIACPVEFDQIPVFVKSGSIIPLNFGSDYILGNSVGNDVTEYKNLTFRIYSHENTDFSWLDYKMNKKVLKNISVKETTNVIHIMIPKIHNPVTFQIINRNPNKILLESSRLKKASHWLQFLEITEGLFFDESQAVLYVKLKGSDRVRNMEIVMHIDDLK